MPKRRDRSVSSDRYTASPFLCSSSRSKYPFAENGLENEDNVKEWEEARCPVCMEHPHNAILLLCSSHDKGCRPFMCDTSYRHSNCFDQFKKSFAKDPEIAEEGTISVPASQLISDSLVSLVSEAAITNASGGNNEEGSSIMNPILLDDHVKPKLMCPLCRGEINGWIIVDSARRFMNAKGRSCACETCDFSGTYSDLRKHARAEHPSVRPTVADPERQRKWSRLERRRDFGDLLSSLQSPVVGESTLETPPEFDEGNWLTVFFLVRVFRAGSDSLSRGRAVVSGTRVTSGRRSRILWGESTDEEEVQSRARNESSDITPAPGGDYVGEPTWNELPGSNSPSSARSIGPSGTTIGTLRRRSRRQREEPPDEEVQDESSDGGPERRRLRRRRRTSSDN
ncbi:hypothetical protein LIER_13541 [Lithospermum erythrorhizon]|uniref:Uncharacterized protein n=1 Tax=Lithospermum erythrorhizon TaxID=34254 RepID=A0AAV3Q0D9_LITER